MKILASNLALIIFCVFPILTLAQQIPELIVRTGHNSIINSLSFSADGKILASVGADRVIKLWDVQSGAEIRSLAAGTTEVVSVSFSPDGKILASGARDQTITLWDVVSGKILRTLAGRIGPVRELKFTPDGRQLVAEGTVDITLWDVETGTQLRTLLGRAGEIGSIAVSPDGKVLASGHSYFEKVKLWDIDTGNEIGLLTGHSGGIMSVAFSADGKWLASGSLDKTIRIWDVASQKETRQIAGYKGFGEISFRPDGKSLLGGGGDRTIKLWDVETGVTLRTVVDHVPDEDVVSQVKPSPNGKILASGILYESIALWDFDSGKRVGTLAGNFNAIESIAFSPDGLSLASAGGANLLWGVGGADDARPVRTEDLLKRVAFGRDGNAIAIASDYGEVELRTLKEVKSWKGPRRAAEDYCGGSRRSTEIAFSPNGKTLASASADGKLRLWNVQQGRLLKTVTDLSCANSLAFSPDGQILAAGLGYSSIAHASAVELWNANTGAHLRSILVASKPLVLFGAKARTVIIVLSGGTTKFIDVDTWVERDVAAGGSIISVAASPDGRLLALGRANNEIGLWDILQEKEVAVLKGHSDAVNAVAFSPDGKTLASGSGDGTIRLWEVATTQWKASLLNLGEEDWLVVTPDGLFDGSPGAWKKLFWRFDNNTFSYVPVEAFFNEFYHPGLLQEIFRGERPKPLRKDLSQIDIRQPAIRLSARLSTKPDRRTIKVEVVDNGAKPRNVSMSGTSGAQDIRLFRNGSLVKVWHGDVLKGEDSVPLEATVPIVAGENNFTAYGFNLDNVKSSDATLTIRGAGSLKRKGVAYLIAVGVNRYANSEFDLKFAEPDAVDFAAELKRQQEKLKTFNHVEIVSLTNEEATKANILKAISDIGAKVQPEDSLTVYFAGHGMTEKDRFYLIPHDLGYSGPRKVLDDAAMQAIVSHGISDEEIGTAIEGIDAEQMLLVIDACNSGQALESEETRRGPMNSKGLAQLAYEKGMYILTASQGYQAAKEAAKYGHGYLTYALVEEGLKKGAADGEPKDGQILIREWLDYAVRRVPRMQDEYKNYRELKRDEPSGSAERAAFDVQQPRVFYRREIEPHPMVVAKP